MRSSLTVRTPDAANAMCVTVQVRDAGHESAQNLDSVLEPDIGA
ncbi:hypothetical protein [Kibdelosporangium aridum]|nr:hypothetical protein [Kibdelosporangium aridum]